MVEAISIPDIVDSSNSKTSGSEPEDLGAVPRSTASWLSPYIASKNGGYEQSGAVEAFRAHNPEKLSSNLISAPIRR